MSEEYKPMTMEDVLGSDFSEYVIQGVKQPEVLTLESYQKQLQELRSEISKVARAYNRARYSVDGRDDEKMYELESRDGELRSLVDELEGAWLTRVKELEAREQELLKLKSETRVTVWFHQDIEGHVGVTDFSGSRQALEDFERPENLEEIALELEEKGFIEGEYVGVWNDSYQDGELLVSSYWEWDLIKGQTMEEWEQECISRGAL